MNSEKVQKKSRLNSEKIWEYGRKVGWILKRNGSKLWKDMKNTEENSGNVGKIPKKIVKRYGKYWRKVSCNV